MTDVHSEQAKVIRHTSFLFYTMFIILIKRKSLLLEGTHIFKVIPSVTFKETSFYCGIL